MYRMLTRGVLLTAYFYIYEHWRIYALPWNSVVTWVVAAILCDVGYYWVHRASHGKYILDFFKSSKLIICCLEINILWAAHQLHHSSEDFNLTTAFRNSGVMMFGNWVFPSFHFSNIPKDLKHFAFQPFYLPMAFFLPPTQMLIHSQFNVLWGFWSHTEAIEDCGILEHIFVTPKHHRVHHGSNRYCLDKNYGSVLIIWDKIFGTFQEEKKDEKIVYGLVDQPQFFNPLKHHVTCFSTSNFDNFFKQSKF